MKYLPILLIYLQSMTHLHAQQKDLPYAKIPDSPQSYTAGAVVSRMLDGLGFRYYWATQGLRKEDLIFKPSNDARTTEETIDHILQLSQIILNCALHKANTTSPAKVTFDEKREKTLKNIQQASHIFVKATDLSTFSLIFSTGNNKVEFPFWNQINGPIADALWHVGQIVSFRRTSGNPLPKGVHVLKGIKN